MPMASSFFALLLSFLVCCQIVNADILAVPNDTKTTQLLLKHQIGLNLLAAYQSLVLANKLNGSILRNDGPSNNDQCWKDLTNIKNNPAQLIKCNAIFFSLVHGLQNHKMNKIKGLILYGQM